ncbi:MAG TPA: EAL domain-containing protein [Actinomycetota bacterium]|jgi:diguanylate cyclase (GGDEF)-like protein|nr:EAL domain-containing protein [Actinomycetota bacterium]
MSAHDLTDVDLVPGEVADQETTPPRTRAVKIYEIAVSFPVIAIIAWSLFLNPNVIHETGIPPWQILVWIVAIAAVDLMPVPTAMSSVAFSLSFPIELSVAMLFPVPLAGLIALLGTSDNREIRGELPFFKGLFIRTQVAAAALCESIVFKRLYPSWVELTQKGNNNAILWRVAVAVVAASVVGYLINILFVAVYNYFWLGESPMKFVREVHAGVFGEFLISYMGLALFSVLVITGYSRYGIFSVGIFLAPLLFARQMFQRTHSLQQATDELAVRQAENEHQALHDSLTGMPNRMFFHQRLLEELDHARATEGRMAVMLMDLDHFKEINDTLGHHFGDMLLQEIGPRLSGVLRDNDLMARLGGDEFGIVLPDLPSEEIALRIADRVLEELEQPVAVEGLALDVSGSVGIAMFPMHAEDAETLLRRADVAMYVAKENGGGYEVYQDSFDRHNPQRLTLIGQVRPALESGEFVMYYQPKVRLMDGRVAGAEALIRWEHPTLGLVPPDEFIPLVEKTVLLRPLTHYVAETVLNQWKEWAGMGIRIPLAINVSPRSLLDSDFPDSIQQLLQETQVPPAFLRIELTEGFLMGDSGRSISVLDALANVGVGLSIDDFGTGYSSLSYLKRLPIEEIKVDRSFVMQMHVDANDFMIVRATVDLGRNLGLRVVAEGVEDLATFDRLADFGCDEAQGYYISKPLSAVEFTRWLSVRNLDRESGEVAESENRRAPKRGLHAI